METGETKDNAQNVGRPVGDDLLLKRRAFYEDHIEEIVIDCAMAKMKSGVFAGLATLCETNVKTEYLAAKRHAEKHNLLRKVHSDNSDDEFTAFGNVAHGGERYLIDISEIELFIDKEKMKCKKKSDFTGELIKMIFEQTRKPCAWSFGRVFSQDGEIKLHAVCLNGGCDARLVLYTENEQSGMRLIIYGYDPTVPHTKKRYLTSATEKSKVEALLEVESAMVTRAKLANEYMFEENEYAAHLSSNAALKQRKHRMLSKSYRHEDSAISIKMMKREPAYKHTISDIGLDPFQSNHHHIPANIAVLRAQNTEEHFFI